MFVMFVFETKTQRRPLNDTIVHFPVDLDGPVHFGFSFSPINCSLLEQVKEKTCAGRESLNLVHIALTKLHMVCRLVQFSQLVQCECFSREKEVLLFTSWMPFLSPN